MAYATSDDYAQYGNGSIPAESLGKALDAASDAIDSLTYSRIIGRGFDSLTPFQQFRVKKAVCQHADFTYQYGDYLNMPLQSYGAGSISMSFKAEEGAGGVQTSRAVIELLKATGLTDRRLC